MWDDLEKKQEKSEREFVMGNISSAFYDTAPGRLNTASHPIILSSRSSLKDAGQSKETNY
jgi:hypothetical protein